MCNAWNHSFECCCSFGGSTRIEIIKSQQIIEKEIRKISVKIVGSDGYILPKDYSMGFYYNNREYVELTQVQSTLAKKRSKVNYKLIKYLSNEIFNLDIYELIYENFKETWKTYGLFSEIIRKRMLFHRLEPREISEIKGDIYRQRYIKTDCLLHLIKNPAYYSLIGNQKDSQNCQQQKTLEKTSLPILSINQDALETERTNFYNNTAISKWHECNSSDRIDASKYWGYLAREYNGSRFGSYPMCDDYGDESSP